MIIAILFGAMIKQNMLTYIKLIMFLMILNNIILHLFTYLLVFGGIIWSQILFETIYICWIMNVYIYIVTTPTQPQLNSKVGFDMKMTLNHHQPPPPPPTTQTQIHIVNTKLFGSSTSAQL